MLARVVSEGRRVIETSWDFLANVKQAQHASKLEMPLKIAATYAVVLWFVKYYCQKHTDAVRVQGWSNMILNQVLLENIWSHLIEFEEGRGKYLIFQGIEKTDE